MLRVVFLVPIDRKKDFLKERPIVISKNNRLVFNKVAGVKHRTIEAFSFFGRIVDDHFFDFFFGHLTEVLIGGIGSVSSVYENRMIRIHRYVLS